YSMQYIEGQTLAEVIQGLRRLEGRGDDSAHASTWEKRAPNGDRSTATVPATLLGRPGQAASPRSPAPGSGSSIRSRAFFRPVAQLGIQAAEALEYAHQQGGLHRDVKPSNLLVDTRGTLWVTDFGLARFQGDASLTMTGDIVGTLRYMSPEQALAKR